MRTCGDCDCKEGELHNFFPNCDMETCPLCRGQLLSCSCDMKEITDSIREPHFDWVFCCRRCGKTMPKMKMVSKEEWLFICGLTYDKECILCEDCMDFIKKKRTELKKLGDFY